MRKKKFPGCRFAALTAAAALALTACGSSAEAGSDGELTVGVVANLSGQAAATFGVPFRHGLELAMADIEQAGVLDETGLSLTLQVEDGKSETAAAVTAFNKLVQAGAPVVLHDSQSPLGQAIAPLANDRRVAFVSGTGSQMENPEGYAFRFTDLLTTTAAAGQHMEEQGIQRVGAIIARDNPSFETLADATEQSLNGKYAITEEIGSADTNFAAVLENLRAADLDAVVLSVLPDQVGNILIQMKQTGGFEDVLAMGTVATSEEAYTIGGSAAEELVFPQAWAPGLGRDTGFEQAYIEKYEETPTSYAGLGYQVGWIVAAAVIETRAAGEEPTGQSLRDHLPAASTSELVAEHGVLDLTLTADGTAITEGVLATFSTDGTIVAVEE